MTPEQSFRTHIQLEMVAVKIEQFDFSGIPGCIDRPFDDAAFLPRLLCKRSERIPVILELEVQRYSYTCRYACLTKSPGSNKEQILVTGAAQVDQL
jgi:hypothetical protein